jgi:hypothetical protein
MADITPMGGAGVTPQAQLMQMAMGFLVPGECPLVWYGDPSVWSFRTAALSRY